MRACAVPLAERPFPLKFSIHAQHLESLAGYVRETFARGWATCKTIARKGPTPRQRRLTLLAFASFSIGMLFCAFMAWLIASIARDPSGFALLLEEHFVLATVSYALVNTLQVFAAFIPGEPLELVAGYLFGTWGGLLVVSAGLALGEALVFVLVKRYGTRLVHLFVSQEKLDELSFFHNTKRLNVVVFLLMFIPGTPKDLVTYIVGLTPMRLSTWMAICVPARVLSIVASTVVGAQVAQDNWQLALAIFGVTCVVSVGGLLYYAAISRQAHEAAIIEELGRREWEAGGRKTNDAASGR